MFIQEQSRVQEKQQKTDVYHLKLDKSEDLYISQFIILSDEIQKVDPQNNIPEEIIDSTLPQKKKRSQFHNFQKHLITTIKRNVQLNIPEYHEKYMEAAKAIWKVFRQIKKYTKQFLSAITNPTARPELLAKYGLMQIYLETNEADFRKAQQFINSEIVRCFQESTEMDFLYDRRLQKKEQFAQYLHTSLEQMRSGSLNRRMAKPVFKDNH